MKDLKGKNKKEELTLSVQGQIRNSYYQALLDLLAHFGGWETPISMSSEEVQEEIIKFMSEVK